MRQRFLHSLMLLSVAWIIAGCGGASEPSRTVTTDTNTGAPTRVNTPTFTESPANEPNGLTPAELSGELSKYLVNGSKSTNVARAQAQLFQDGLRFYLIVVAHGSTGLEGEIYQDLVKRNFRATTGPDEGFDTQSLECHPNCVFVPQDAVDALGVEGWASVLRHEQRHMVQAANNPELARAFRRTEESLFTTYAAFLEACADDGINVAEETYHATERMRQLRNTLGAEYKSEMERACEGYEDAYQGIVTAYEAKAGKGAFAKLFPPYK